MVLNPAPFKLPGGKTGILLIHGFTASPTQVRLLGDYLHQRGLTVSAPLLPGHGTTVSDLSQQRWQNWSQHVNLAFNELTTHCTNIFVAGISLGSLLTLQLATEHSEINGIVLYSPLLKMPGGPLIQLVPAIKYLKPEIRKRPDFATDPHALDQLWDYDSISLFAVHELLRLRKQVQRSLPRITTPALIIYSTLDRLIGRHSAQYTYDHLGVKEKTLIALHNSGHDVTLDSEWETVAAQTYKFIQTRIK
jgi:carboxylesterase